MVTIGFIGEGDSETILFKSDSFQNYLADTGILSSPDFIINAEGKYKLYHPNGDFSKLKERMDGWLKSLYNKGCDVVFILLDRDNDDTCYNEFKSKVYRHADNVVIVAKHELEAWFLSDTDAISSFLQISIIEIGFPEDFLEPLKEIKRLNLQYKGRGVSDKTILTRSMLRCNFSLAKAAAHPNCPSAAYFQRKLTEAARK